MMFISFIASSINVDAAYFGSILEDTPGWGMGDIISGSPFECVSNGVAYSISAYIENTDVHSNNATCALYYESNRSLINMTEEKDIPLGFGPGWMIFNFTAGFYPNLTIGTEYILVIYSECCLQLNIESIPGKFYDPARVYDGLFPDPLPNVFVNGIVASIYCTYNSSPVFSNPVPTNGSTTVSPSTTQLNITINDPEGEVFNWTIETKPNIGSDGDDYESNGTKTCTVAGLVAGVNYTWWVNATNNASINASAMYWFTAFGNITFWCYNESNTSETLYFGLEISNQNGSKTYQDANITSGGVINSENLPTGNDIVFVVNSTGYATRSYLFDVISDTNYTFSFYLAPLTYQTDYILHVINEYDSAVDEAKIDINRLINGTYTTIYSGLTDGNGDTIASLIPTINYKVYITKSGYQTGISDYPPSTSVFTKTFKIYESNASDYTIWTNLGYTFEPPVHDQYDNFTFYYNTSSSDNMLEYSNLTVYLFNTTTTSWTELNTTNNTNAGGTSLSYTTIDGVGMYGFECIFKKENYSRYTFGTDFYDETVLIYNIWLGSGANTSWIDDGLTDIIGDSPVSVGDQVVAYTSLAICGIATFFLFTFSTRFAGLSIMITGIILGAFREPLNFVSDDILSYSVIGIIVILGFITFITEKKTQKGGS